MKKISSDAEGHKNISRKEIADRLNQSAERLLTNLLLANQVQPDDLSPEQSELLQEAIAKAESFYEKMRETIKKIETKD